MLDNLRTGGQLLAPDQCLTNRRAQIRRYDERMGLRERRIDFGTRAGVTRQADEEPPGHVLWRFWPAAGS
jgi:hypothetical protein